MPFRVENLLHQRYERFPTQQAYSLKLLFIISAIET